MAETENTIVQRPQIHHYMNLGTKAAPNFLRMGKGWKKITENPNAQTESVQYVCDYSETTDTTGYAPNYAFECDLMHGDEAIKRVYDIAKGRKTYGDCIVQVVTVDAFEETADNTSCTAYLEDLAVQVTSIDGTKKMSLTGNFNGQGDGIKGKFDLKTLKFTPDSESADSTSDGGTETST